MVKFTILHRKLGGYKKRVSRNGIFISLVDDFLTFFKSFVFSLNNLLWLWYRHSKMNVFLYR